MNKKSIAVVVVVVALLAFFMWQIQPTSNQDTVESDPRGQTQISYLDILNNPEFRQKMQLAVTNNDDVLAKSLQDKALEIARAANLPAEQHSMLSGDDGLNFMQFLAKRQLFSQAFERHYLQLKPIDELKQRYPEAQDLFEQSDKLIQQRDANINIIAQQLASGEPIEPYLEMARQLWIDKAQQTPPSQP